MAKKIPVKKRPKPTYVEQMPTEGDKIANAIDMSLYSEKLGGRGEGNLVEVIHDLARNAAEIASAISTSGEGEDAAGGTIRCLTSSVMGVTAGLVKIAEAIHDLADAVRESKK